MGGSTCERCALYCGVSATSCSSSFTVLEVPQTFSALHSQKVFQKQHRWKIRDGNDLSLISSSYWRNHLYSHYYGHATRDTHRLSFISCSSLARDTSSLDGSNLSFSSEVSSSSPHSHSPQIIPLETLISKLESYSSNIARTRRKSTCYGLQEKICTCVCQCRYASPACIST